MNYQDYSIIASSTPPNTYALITIYEQGMDGPSTLIGTLQTGNISIQMSSTLSASGNIMVSNETEYVFTIQYVYEHPDQSQPGQVLVANPGTYAGGFFHNPAIVVVPDKDATNSSDVIFRTMMGLFSSTFK